MFYGEKIENECQNCHGNSPHLPSWLAVFTLSQAGLEKSSVLPVLDRFLSLKTDFVLNRKQKNRSIKIRFFPSNSKDSLYNSYLSRQFTVNFTPFNTLTCLIRLYTHMYYMTSGCHQLITPMSE